MTILFTAFRLIWKRKLANITLIVQILLSIVMLAQLFVIVESLYNNLRAVDELPTQNTMMIEPFTYYDSNYVMQQIVSSPQVESVGAVYWGNTSFHNVSCNLAAYNNAIIAHYSPALAAGRWFQSGDDNGGQSVIPAVVSGGLGLKLNDVVSIDLPTTTAVTTCKVQVIGILQEPTQYLWPTGGASPEYFAANDIIAQAPVFILPSADLNISATFLQPTTNQMIFTKDGSGVTIDSARAQWGQYGEITPMPSLISVFDANTKDMINTSSLMFGVFLCLAVTGVLSNNVIQSLRNRKQFTIYYLLGMNWKDGVAIELVRTVLLIVICMVFIIPIGCIGWLQLMWMTSAQKILFFGICLAYLLIMFFAVGFGFLLKLAREDLSGSLKDLQQDE